MTQKIIFEKKDIQIHEQKFDGIERISYSVSQGDVAYSTWDKPDFDYDILRKSIADYLEERDRSLMADIENEDFEEDFGGFFDPDTEAY